MPSTAEYTLATAELQGKSILDELRGAELGVETVILDVGDPLDTDALKRSWRTLVARHVALRTAFTRRNGQLLRTALAAHVADDLELNGTELAGGLEAWPHCHISVRTSAAHRHRIAMAFRSVVFDDLSAHLCMREVIDCYSAYVRADTPDLPPVPAEYGSFMAAERNASARVEGEARAYWEPKLAAVAGASRIAESSAGAVAPAGVRIAVDRDTTDRLVDLARQHRSSLLPLLVAALQVVQWRYAGGEDSGVATALKVDVRPRAFRHSVGMFSNELPLFTSLAHEQTFAELLDDVTAGAAELFRLKRYPLSEARARFGQPDATAQVSVAYRRSARGEAAEALNVLDWNIMPALWPGRPLAVAFSDEPAGLDIRLAYDRGSIAPGAAHRMAHHLRRLLCAVAERASTRIGRLEMLTGAERARLIGPWARGVTAPDGREATVPELVEAQVARTPEATALVWEHEQVSYAELDRRANRLAHHLQGLGVRAGVVVGVCLPRSTELVVGLLAILKAGGAYLPLDPGYPAERLRVMTEDAAPRVVLSRSGIGDRLPGVRGKLLLLDRELGEVASQPSAPPGCAAGRDDLTYVIFTSGSSGRPKGVAMPHRALVNLLAWQRGEASGGSSLRTLQFASISFDVAFQDIFGTLTTGGALVLIPDELRSDFDRLADFVDRQRIERMFLPPLALEALAERWARTPADSDAHIFAAGERLEITPATRALGRARPNWRLHNHYGPTETHVVAAHSLSPRAVEWPEAPPIGRPIANTRIYLLDRERNPVPAGVPGELHVGGACLARGYLNQPRLTAERFVDDPFEPGARIYRTGDAARWREDGTIEFLGRLDDQIKLRGYRIEPAEIVAALVRHPRVRQAAVIAEDHPHQGRRLVAYVVPTDETAPAGQEELREHLRCSLPDHMVPAAFGTLDALPLTPNGKLDRRALPPPDRAEGDDRGEPPLSATERGVAEIWGEVLGLDRVGADDDFFSLGGHSLLAGEVVAECAKAFAVAVPLRAIFAGPTVRELARAVEAAKRDGTPDQPIPRAERRLLREISADAE